MNLADLVRSLMRISPAELVDDDSAARVIIAVRWPRGPRCAACGQLAELNANALVCADPRCGAHVSIFVGTPLASLRRPSPRSACAETSTRNPPGPRSRVAPQGFAFSYGLGETENPPIRIVGESVRTWLNGTFHGVTARYLPWYLWEATARATRSPAEVLSSALATLLAPAARGA